VCVCVCVCAWITIAQHKCQNGRQFNLWNNYTKANK